MHTLYKKVEKTIKRYEMLKGGDRVLAAVSGGPDSIFLLYALYSICGRLRAELMVANLDHGMRPRASAADSRFVMRAAERLGLKAIHGRLGPFKSGRSGKLSVEEALREKRYTFFKKTARRVHANLIATGHTLDDQAETVLMRVIKGTTIKGLTGIMPRGARDGLIIVRPLIELSKKEILEALRNNGIPYRIDRTNSEERYFRNIVRRRILPYLEKYNPQIKRSLSQMAESLREDREFIESEKKKRSVSINCAGGYADIRLKDVVIQPKALQREIMRDALVKTGAAVKKLTYRHWREMDDFLKFKRKGQWMHLPGGIRVKRTDATLEFYRQ